MRLLVVILCVIVVGQTIFAKVQDNTIGELRTKLYTCEQMYKMNCMRK